MSWNWGDIRGLVISFRGWNSSGPDFDERLRKAGVLAAQRLAGDLPEAFVPQEEHVVLHPPVNSEDATVAAHIEVSGTDTHVLRFTDTAGGALGASALTTWRPNVTGIWDAIMHLEITLPGVDTQVRRRAREFWQNGNEFYVSLDRPWRNLIDKSMTFRIYQKEIFFRDDVTEVLEPARVWDGTRQQVWKIDTGGAYRQALVDFRREVQALPSSMWRGSHFQLPTPTRTPTLDVEQAQWVGPIEEGTFRFRYTYVWGNHDEEWQESEDAGIADPIFESAPSPPSAQFVHTANDEAIIMQGTNIDAMRGFDVAGTLREGHSGLRLRWYVARTAIRNSGLAATADYRRVETDGRYYFLMESQPTAAYAAYGVPSTRWRGDIIPDYSRPLRHSSGYYGWQLYPHQDQRYELDFRVLRQTRPFIDDYDTPPFPDDVMPIFLEILLHYACLMDGVDDTTAQQHLSNYRGMLPVAIANYGNPGGVVEPVPLHGHRLRHRYGQYREG